MVHIWREIFAALTALQGPFSVAVHQPEGGPDYAPPGARPFRRRDADHQSRPCRPRPCRGQRRLGQRRRAAATGWRAKTEPWWRYLISDRPDRARIVARLPAVIHADPRQDALGALVIACVAFEDSGGDHSYLDFQSQEEISRVRFQTALSDHDLVPFFYTAWRDEEHPIAWHHLVGLPGHWDEHDDAIRRLTAEFEPRIDRVHALGGYPAPVDIADEADDGKDDDGDDGKGKGKGKRKRKGSAAQ